jgi:hypothetical protein
VQFVDARELQERMQQQVGRGRVQEWTVRRRRPRVQARGGLSDGGAVFGLAMGGMDGRGRMVKVKIGRGAVAVAHKLLWAVVALADGPGCYCARGCLARQGVGRDEGEAA